MAAFTDPPDISGAFEDGPLVHKPRPWYDGLFGNWFVRLLIFAAIVYGVKSFFGGTTTTSQNPSIQKAPPPTVQPQPPTPSASPAQAVLPTSSPAASPPSPKPAAPPPKSASDSTTSAGTWLYRVDDKEFGPFDESALQQLCKAGVISASSQIRRVNGANWITYADVFGDT
jgi:hypothetical protein